MASITDIDWKALVGKIRKEKSILILGPGAYLSAQNRPLLAHLLEELDLANNVYIQKYYSDDNLFLFKKGGGRGFTSEHIEDFYYDKKPSLLLQQIAKLPFHVILSVTPDRLLPKAFQAEKFDYQFDHYKKKQEPAKIKRPSKELPLIYNLLGCIDQEESLILTHNDLYDYFKSIFELNSLPEQLRQALKMRKINCFIFLGVPFDKWYMQLIIRELGIHQNQDDFIRYAVNQSMTEDLKTFCDEQFTIQFVDHNIPDFVAQLYQISKKLRVLRSRTDNSKWKTLKQIIASGDLKLAINTFIDLVRGTDLADEAKGLSGRYRRFERKKNNGVLDSRDIPVQENQIASSLLDLVQEAENL